jgi:hypothetical protein
MKRDLSKSQFEYRARKAGFTPDGFLGYWKSPNGISISVLNAGKRRRDWLPYLLRQNKLSLEREAQRTTKEAA